MSDADEPQAEASLATSRSRRDRGRKKASRLQELDNLKASRIHGKRQLGIHFYRENQLTKNSSNRRIHEFSFNYETIFTEKFNQKIVK